MSDLDEETGQTLWRQIALPVVTGAGAGAAVTGAIIFLTVDEQVGMIAAAGGGGLIGLVLVVALAWSYLVRGE
ncbi:MAG: hypothetical protein U5K37_05795 [Natrialbaceae archaeon]|nr:hypothetical protein [Natrialbaceae archaeon]